MKKLIVLLVIVSSFAFAEVWDTHLTTSLNVSNAQDIKLFSNSFGNNILVLSSAGALTYYVMSTNAVVSNSVSIESDGVSNPCITGNGYKTYIVYSRNNVVKAKYTTDAGVNWLTLTNLGVDANSLDAAYTDRLHITYSYNNYIKYYEYINGWTNAFDVSGTENGTLPRIQPLFNSSNHKIYVVYQNGNNCKSRELDVPNNQWDILHSLYTNMSNSPYPIGFGVDESYIYNYFTQAVWDPLYGRYLTETNENTIRKSDYTVIYSSTNNCNYFYIKTTNTADNKVHTAFNLYHITGKMGTEVQDGIEHEFFDNGSESIFNICNPQVGSIRFVYISSSYNDLFVTWKATGSSYLSYAHYNTNPSTPQNLTLTSQNDHPKLTWTKNPDADIYQYVIYKKKGADNYIQYATTSSTEFIDNVESVCELVPPEYCQYETIAKYKILAKDLDNLTSGFSNEVRASLIGSPPQKVHAGGSPIAVNSYKLNQNYPNPFNPTTKINYQIPDKGMVSLKVYDMLGREVAELVNELKEQGTYDVVFNSTNLPSGVYIYSLRVNDFVENQKMTLLK